MWLSCKPGVFFFGGGGGGGGGGANFWSGTPKDTFLRQPCLEKVTKLRHTNLELSDIFFGGVMRLDLFGGAFVAGNRFISFWTNCDKLSDPKVKPSLYPMLKVAKLGAILPPPPQRPRL